MIDLRYLKDFDFNTLPIFLCVYKHVSVLKAAKELQVSSANVTHNINKLRKYFNDPLFIRVGQGIRPTAFCKILHHTISPNFDDLCNFINTPKSKPEVIVYSPDGPILNMINKYARLIRDGYPKIVHYSLVADTEFAMELFAFRKADIIITHEPISSAAIECTKLYTVKLILICRKNHPRINQLLELANYEKKYGEELWVTLNTDSSFHHSLREHKKLSHILKNRRVIFESSVQNVNVQFIEESDAVGFVAEPILKSLHPARYANLAILPVPVVEVDLYINRRNNSDSSVTKVVEMLQSLEY